MMPLNSKMFLNFRMPDLHGFETSLTDNITVLTAGIRLGIEPGGGKIRASVTDHISLEFLPADPPPRWIEFVVSLPGSDWRECRQIFLRYRATGKGIRLRPALRLGQDASFHDHFAPSEHVLAADVANYNAEFLLPPRWARTAVWMDLHLFFLPEKGRVALYDLTLTGVL